MPTIKIGVHVQGSPERLKKTLASLSRNRELPFELVLLLDGAKECDFDSQLEFQGIARSSTQFPQGAAACFNRLVKQRLAEFYVFLENGVEFGGPWLHFMMEAMDRYHGCGIAGPSTNRGSNCQLVLASMADGEKDIVQSARRVRQRFGAACRLLDTRHELSSFCYVVRDSVCQKIGEADEAYLAGTHWETDYNVRAHRAGFRSIWVCGAYAHRAPAAGIPAEDVDAAREPNERRYQDKFCGLRLRGLKDDYRAECRGDACPHFAPAELICNPVATAVAIEDWPPPEGPAVEPPLVSCIMPTYNRRQFIPRALRCFSRQDYANLELLIVDDGTDPISDLLPDDPRIRYWHLPNKQPIGAKRNFACSEARGEYIAHWDDDDWYPRSRISRQVTALRESGASICGSSTIFYFQAETQKAYRYECPSSPAPWLGPVAYARHAWEENRFPAVPVAEDVKFVAKIPGEKRIDLRDPSLCVASIHTANASPKKAVGKYWLAEPLEKIIDLLPPDDDCALICPRPPVPERESVLQNDFKITSSGTFPNSKVAKPPELKPAPSRDPLVSNSQEPATPLEFRSGLSVVICHGGQERLPNLKASLVNLRQCSGFDEVVVVEMGKVPFAAEISRRWADKYFFVRNEGPFERSRCLNIGAALADFDLILWRDNDLLMRSSFIEAALEEMRSRQLDYLIPFTSVDYLSVADSKEIEGGLKGPNQCNPANALHENRGTAGLVRKSFLGKYGGMCEEFRGWGGEDDAWWFKAKLLGSAGISRNASQRLYHLFHPDSGGYRGNRHIRGNPYYAENLSALRRICAITDRDEFLKRQPPKLTQCCNWNDKRVFLVHVKSDDRSRLRAAKLEDWLRNFSSDKTEWIVTTLPEDFSRECTLKGHPDSVLLFGMEVATEFLSSPARKDLWKKSIVELTGGDLSHEGIKTIRKAGAVCAYGTAERLKLQEASIDTWPLREPLNPPSLETSGRLLLQPISLILANPSGIQSAGAMEVKPAMAAADETTAPVQLPTWMYWEGDCPEWIRLCHQTIRAHGHDVRLLSPADFNRLWERDRDIDIARLYVAHRSDFIRAYLLAHFGGIWIDSDCILMQSLQPILAALRDFEFVAHRERSGDITNDLLAARPESAIARAFYRQVCEVLRNKRNIAWTAIGGEPLTALLSATRDPWHEIPCERIQPVCWSNPGAFFATNSPAGHERLVDSRALCYMLSNGAVKQFQLRNPSKDLLGGNTFFRYLVNKSLENAKSSAAPPSSSNPPAPTGAALPFCIEAVTELAPLRVLDVGVGLGRWGMLVRDFCEESSVKSDRSKWKLHVEGIQLSGEAIAGHHEFLYDRIQPANGNLCQQIHGNWNLAILDGVLGNWPKQESSEILSLAMDAADYVMVHNSFVSESDPTPSNDHSRWKLSEFLSLAPVRYDIFSGPSAAGHAAFLFSRNDPNRLRPVNQIESLFGRMEKEYGQAGEESVSGPGSSLQQTSVIRERLPLLVEDVGARTLLDAPCGDFNWMRHVKLGVREYIGVDVLRELVARNQQAFGGTQRKFLRLDLMTDVPPGADLILCRDCLVHFSIDDIFRVLRNFKRSGSKYLLTTTFVRTNRNEDIATGGWRPLNFQLPPFNFQSPFRIIDEKCTEGGGRFSDKSLGLWRIEDIRI